MKLAVFIWVLLLLFVFALIGCSQDDDDDDSADDDSASCPDVSGTWTLTEHCEADLIGSALEIVQVGCDLTEFGTWEGWTGTVEPDGSTQWSGNAGTTPMTCTGAFVGNTVSVTCDPPCDVEAVKN